MSGFYNDFNNKKYGNTNVLDDANFTHINIYGGSNGSYRLAYNSAISDFMLIRRDFWDDTKPYADTSDGLFFRDIDDMNNGFGSTREWLFSPNNRENANFSFIHNEIHDTQTAMVALDFNTRSIMQKIGDKYIEFMRLQKEYDEWHLTMINTKQTELNLSGSDTLSEVYGPNVTQIGEFFSTSHLKIVDLPNLKTLGYQRFSYCKELTKLKLPNLKTVDHQCFMHCDKLTDLDLPILETAGSLCFYNCKELTNLNLPNLKTVGSDCFRELPSIREHKYPQLESIGADCFYLSKATKSLTELIELPNLKSLPNGCFKNLGEQVKIKLPAALQSGFLGRHGVQIQINRTPNKNGVIPPIELSADILNKGRGR